MPIILTNSVIFFVWVIWVLICS